MHWTGLLILACLLGSAGGHDLSVAAIEVTADRGGVVVELDVSLSRLARAGVLPASADAFAALDAKALSAAGPAIAGWLRPRLRLTVDGEAATLIIDPPRAGYERSPINGQEFLERALITVRVPASRAPQRVRLDGDFSDWPGSTVLLKARWPPGSDEPWTVSNHDPLFTWQAGEPLSWWRFVGWGVHHILIGFDHIAFLLGLLLVARRLRALIGVITAFTVAHSITLALAATGTVPLGDGERRLIEVVIAVSIVAVAIENLVVGEPRWRWLSTFVFGLVHGFGFAAVLAQHLPTGSVAQPLVGFNLGVELGQLAVVAMIWPLLWLIRRSADPERGERRRRWAIRGGSLLIALLGGLWLIDRVFGTGIMAWTG